MHASSKASPAVRLLAGLQSCYHRSPLVGYLLALTLGVIAAWLVIGSPLYILRGGLMNDSDYPNAAAAFLLFVQDGWHWPLGANPDFGGVNVFFSDAAPWFALSGKALHSLTGITVSFHFLVLLNFLLLGVTAWRLARRVCDDEASRWVLAGLLVFNLIMPVRLIGAQHIALGSYWVLLWAMCAVPARGESRGGWRQWECLAATGFAIWSHAYLGAMAITIMLVSLLAARRWFAALWVLLLPIILLYVIGALGGEHASASGAKVYALDLGAFTKSLGWAMTGNLYDIHEVTQGDAILYLGSGVWLLLIGSVVISLARKELPRAAILGQGVRRHRLLTVLLASLGLMLYAMAFDLRIAGHVWASMDIPAIFLPLYESFRATGRFAAPMAYCLVIIATLWWAAWRQRVRGWWMLGVVAVLLQASDAWYAGDKSRPSGWRADADSQHQAVAALLDGRDWSGRVFRDVDFHELEQQRLLDYLLVEHGADRFEVAHGARLSWEDVKRRSGYKQAVSGDVVILSGDADGPECRDSASLKQFEICLL